MVDSKPLLKNYDKGVGVLEALLDRFASYVISSKLTGASLRKILSEKRGINPMLMTLSNYFFKKLTDRLAQTWSFFFKKHYLICHRILLVHPHDDHPLHFL
ncbi:MAG: hypothetical protein A4E65_03058 [Syntrophorhabdus sp. PtaU1.Bin153]|nr:MAG: hypothetical protein A4E65_03058 [Syntrophorhabdus sp. PtaU1.Bin153]